MPASSVAVRSLALALLGLGAASSSAVFVPAWAQSANVTAFNPYNGVGLQAGGPTPAASAVQPAPPPTAGMAFNPWQPAGAGAAVVPPPAASNPSYTSYFSRAANLPPPPPGPIESRLLAIPELGSRAPARSQSPPAPMAASAPPTPTATVSATPPAVPAAAPPEPVASRPPVPLTKQAKPTLPAATASATPTPAASPAPVVQPAPPPTPPAPSPATAMASLPFASQSAEINGEARSELDRLAKTTLSRARQVELRAYASGPDPADARKVALARALAVRSYLIDLGVKSRIEVGAFSANGHGGASDRVDVFAPGS